MKQNWRSSGATASFVSFEEGILFLPPEAKLYEGYTFPAPRAIGVANNVVPTKRELRHPGENGLYEKAKVDTLGFDARQMAYSDARLSSRVAPIRRGGPFMSATVKKPGQAMDRTG
jgi:hypothetical protein